MLFASSPSFPFPGTPALADESRVPCYVRQAVAVVVVVTQRSLRSSRQRRGSDPAVFWRWFAWIVKSCLLQPVSETGDQGLVPCEGISRPRETSGWMKEKEGSGASHVGFMLLDRN